MNYRERFKETNDHDPFICRYCGAVMILWKIRVRIMVRFLMRMEISNPAIMMSGLKMEVMQDEPFGGKPEE